MSFLRKVCDPAASCNAGVWMQKVHWRDDRGSPSNLVSWVWRAREKPIRRCRSWCSRSSGFVRSSNIRNHPDICCGNRKKRSVIVFWCLLWDALRGRWRQRFVCWEREGAGDGRYHAHTPRRVPEGRANGRAPLQSGLDRYQPPLPSACGTTCSRLGLFTAAWLPVYDKLSQKISRESSVDYVCIIFLYWQEKILIFNQYYLIMIFYVCWPWWNNTD